MPARESRPRHAEPYRAERAVITGDVLDRSGEELAAVIRHYQDENPCIKRVTRIRRTGPVTSDPVDRLPAPGDSLAEHLSRRLCMGTHDPRTLALANWIIWNLDGRGICATTSSSSPPPPALILPSSERALAVVQSLDPIGVGARSLRECLLLQMRAQADPDPVVIQLISGLIRTNLPLEPAEPPLGTPVRRHVSRLPPHPLVVGKTPTGLRPFPTRHAGVSVCADLRFFGYAGPVVPHRQEAGNRPRPRAGRPSAGCRDGRRRRGARPSRSTPSRRGRRRSGPRT